MAFIVASDKIKEFNIPLRRFYGKYYYPELHISSFVLPANLLKILKQAGLEKTEIAAELK